MMVNELQSIPLNSAEKKQILGQVWPALLLASGIFLLITLLNLAMHFMDVLTGIESLGRPPVSRLWIIELIALLIGAITFLYLTKAPRKDLMKGHKVVEIARIKRKFAKRENGTLLLKIVLSSNRTVQVSKDIFEVAREGDDVKVQRTEFSEIVFNVQVAQ